VTDRPDRAPESTDPPPSTVTIVARANGPLLVDGPVRLTDADGTVTEVDRLFLCRCGHSDAKPRCDGSHKRNGFQAPGVAPTSRSGGQG